MPVFDGRNLTEQCEDEALLAMVLYPTSKARDEARARGRMRVERATMVPGRVQAVPGTRRPAAPPVVTLPVT